jgi:putative SOS response-associated peptidase YedK
MIMCGRFSLSTSMQSLIELFEPENIPELAPRFNIAPTQDIAAVRQPLGTTHREFTQLHWGLIPFWAKDKKIGQKMINARSETVAEKPAFRNSFKKKRCLVPVTGFFEWQKLKEGKQPFFIGRKDKAPFAFAGLWDHWQGTSGETVESCTLLTTQPNGILKPIHNRMPVILAKQDFEKWLDPEWHEAKGLIALLKPYPEKEMVAFAVSKKVNNPRFDDPECIRPV